MDLTLKIMAGPRTGEETSCGGAETYLGRSQRCGIILNHPSISFEHAIISRVGDEFFLENLSANGTFLNNERITAKTRLRQRDQIRLGTESVLRILSLPGVQSGGSKRRLLVIATVVMILLLMAVVIVDPFSNKVIYDWPGAYTQLQAYVQKETDAKSFGPETSTMFRDAWRLEQARDRAHSGPIWLKLHILLMESDPNTHIQEAARGRPRALERLLKPAKDDPAPTDEDLSAALLQFVTQMERVR
jgi:pSer/pThr/pTyr-binding forkhead associated (FHA) protein